MSCRMHLTSETFAEVPAYVFCMFTMDHLGRKPLMVASMLVGGIFTLICALFEEGGLRTTMAILGEEITARSWINSYENLI